MTHEEFHKLPEPKEGLIRSVFIEGGAYDGNNYALEGYHDIRIGPDGFAYVCIGKQEDLPETQDE